MFTDNGKDVDIMLPIAPVKPLGRDFTHGGTGAALGLFAVSRGMLGYDVMQMFY